MNDNNKQNEPTEPQSNQKVLKAEAERQRRSIIHSVLRDLQNNLHGIDWPANCDAQICNLIERAVHAFTEVRDDLNLRDYEFDHEPNNRSCFEEGFNLAVEECCTCLDECSIQLDVQLVENLKKEVKELLQKVLTRYLCWNPNQSTSVNSSNAEQ